MTCLVVVLSAGGPSIVRFDSPTVLVGSGLKIMGRSLKSSVAVATPSPPLTKLQAISEQLPIAGPHSCNLGSDLLDGIKPNPGAIAAAALSALSHEVIKS